MEILWFFFTSTQIPCQPGRRSHNCFHQHDLSDTLEVLTGVWESIFSGNRIHVTWLSQTYSLWRNRNLRCGLVGQLVCGWVVPSSEFVKMCLGLVCNWHMGPNVPTGMKGGSGSWWLLLPGTHQIVSPSPNPRSFFQQTDSYDRSWQMPHPR